MFCYQCEQTAKGTGCNVSSVCGKDPHTADLQDVLLRVAMGVSMYAHELRKNGIKDGDLDLFVIEALFSTVTNVNFDPQTLVSLIKRGESLRDGARAKYNGPELGGPAVEKFPTTMDELVAYGLKVSTEGVCLDS